MRRGQPRQSTSTSATRTLLVSFFFSSRRRHTRSCLVSWARDVYKRQRLALVTTSVRGAIRARCGVRADQNGRMLTITLPYRRLVDSLGADPARVRVVEWGLTEPLAADVAAEVDVVVVPYYMADSGILARLRALPRLRLVQLPSAGYEHALPHVPPGVIVCNARGVHDAGTAELAIGLVLASQRGIDVAVRDQLDGRWAGKTLESLADRRVMVLGYGSIGKAIARRLEPFEVEVVAVARTARVEDGVVVHGMDELPGLLPTVDVVILITPVSYTHLRAHETRHDLVC